MQTILRLSIEDYETELTSTDLIEFLGKVPADTTVRVIGRIREVVYDSDAGTVEIS